MTSEKVEIWRGYDFWRGYDSWMGHDSGGNDTIGRDMILEGEQ